MQSGIAPVIHVLGVSLDEPTQDGISVLMNQIVCLINQPDFYLRVRHAQQ